MPALKNNCVYFQFITACGGRSLVNSDSAWDEVWIALKNENNAAAATLYLVSYLILVTAFIGNLIVAKMLENYSRVSQLIA